MEEYLGRHRLEVRSLSPDFREAAALDNGQNTSLDGPHKRAVNEPDAHGRAALLLVESILHTLVERGVFSAEEAATTVQVAAEVAHDLADHAGEARVRMDESLVLLATIKRTFVAYSRTPTV